MRDLQLATIDDVESMASFLNSAWGEVVDTRIITRAQMCWFDFAEETIALMEFKDGTFEVGIGEPLRPYDQVYLGTEGKKALGMFFDTVQDHAAL